MNFRKTGAITIGQRDYSDTSQILTFYTRDYGKITVLARGIKRPKHRLLNPPDLFSHSEIIFINKSPQGMNLLTEITVSDNFPSLRINLARLRMAFYVARFLDELTEPEEPNPELFNLALRTLKQLAGAGSSGAGVKKARKIATNSCSETEKMIIFAFETQALKYLGYMPSTFNCPVCKKAATRSRKVAFSFSNGSVLCPACRAMQLRKDDLIEVSAGVMKLVDVLGNPFLPELERLKIAPSMQKELRGFINKYITYIVNV
ncbi:MAG: DNA repair protein RecO [Planctomycetota bacterium]